MLLSAISQSICMGVSLCKDHAHEGLIEETHQDWTRNSREANLAVRTFIISRYSDRIELEALISLLLLFDGQTQPYLL